MLADLVVVTYHSLGAAVPELQRFARLAEAGDPRLSWSFVDNSEDSSDAAYLEASLPRARHARILRRADNPGFAAACNEAARTSRAEWVLFINPDILLDESVLEVILTTLADTAPEVSCVALSQQTGHLAHQGVSFNRAGWFMDRPLQRGGRGPAGRARVYRVVGGAGAAHRTLRRSGSLPPGDLPEDGGLLRTAVRLGGGR